MTNSLTRAISTAIQRTHEGVCRFCNDDGCPVIVAATEEVRRVVTSWLVEEDTKTILIDTLMREWMKVEDGDIEPMSYNDEAWLVMGALVDHAREDDENPEDGEKGDDSEDGDSDDDDKGDDDDADESDIDGESEEEKGDGNGEGDNDSGDTTDGDPEGETDDAADSESEGRPTDADSDKAGDNVPVTPSEFTEYEGNPCEEIEYEIVYRRGREIKLPVSKRKTYL